MIDIGSSLGAIGVFGAILAVVLVGILIVKRYKIAKPNQAIIVTGGRGREATDDKGKPSRDLSSQKVVTGGGVFVVPFVQRHFTISLESRKLALATEAQTADGITIKAQAVAVVKVGGTSQMIRDAAQRFLGNENEIQSSTEEVLSGSLRALIGTLTVDQIMGDRSAVAQGVLAAAEEALTKQGLIIDTLQIQDIRDAQDYIANRGRPEAARVRQLAEISETRAQQAAEEERIAAQQVILNRNRELKLREAEITRETDKALAEAAAAKPLEDARQQQSIVDQQQITAQKRVALKEQELNSDIRAVADAEAYRAEAIAAATAKANVLAAESERDAQIAQAEADRASGLAQADAIRAIGEAEADTIAARGEALADQAEQILSQEFLKIFPEVVKNYASALGGIGNMTVVSADGASAVSGQTIGGLKGVMEMTHETLGIDLAGILNGAVTGAAAGSAAAGAKSNPRRPRDTHQVAEKAAESPTAFDKAVERTSSIGDQLADAADRVAPEVVRGAEREAQRILRDAEDRGPRRDREI